MLLSSMQQTSEITVILHVFMHVFSIKAPLELRDFGSFTVI